MIFILNGASFSSTIGTIPNISRYIGSVGTGGTGGNIEPIDVKLTFDYSPASATLTLTYNDGTSNQTKTDTGDGTYQLTVKSGTSISWTLKADGYNDKSGTIVMPAWNKTETQSLVSTGGGNTGGDSGESGEPETPVNPPSGTSTTYYFKDRPDSGYLNGGELVVSTKSSTTDYIDISSKPKIGYFGRMGYVAGSTFHAIEFYDANKTYLSSLSVLGDGKEMTVNLDLSESKYANAKYVRASVSQSSFTTEQFNSWHFVVGSFIEKESSPTLETVTSMFPNLGYLGLDGKDVEATSGAYITDYVSLSGKTNIIYKGRMGTIGLNMAFYDSSKNFISGLETVGNGKFITLNINLSDSKYANAAYVKASISKGSLDETTWLSSSFKIS